MSTPEAAQVEKRSLRRDDLALADRLRLPILGPDEAAVLLRLPNRRSVMRLVRRRELPHVRLGGRVLFIRDALVEFLRRQEVAVLDPEAAQATLAAIPGSKWSKPKHA